MRQVAMIVALVLLSLGATGTVPARAMETCAMPPTIHALRDCVQHALDQGVIDTAGVASSLFAKLDAAQAALDRGQPAVAVHLLQAFVNEVTAQAGSHIDTAHAAHMVMHAQLVIAALQGSGSATS